MRRARSDSGGVSMPCRARAQRAMARAPNARGSERNRNGPDERTGDLGTTRGTVAIARIQPMRRDGWKDCLHVFGQYRGVATDHGPRLSSAQQSLSGARRESERQLHARAREQGLYVIEQLVGDEYLAHLGLQREHLGRRQHRRRRLQQIAPLALYQYAPLRGSIRIAEHDAHQEAIELRLGQSEGSELFVRVLRRDHKKRIGQRVAEALDADLPLLHRLEQRALRLRAGAVDLIGEQQLREHWAAPELEALLGAIEDRHS